MVGHRLTRVETLGVCPTVIGFAPRKPGRSCRRAAEAAGRQAKAQKSARPDQISFQPGAGHRAQGVNP
jgi:hypothetical protein